MKAYKLGTITVLAFRDTEEAHKHGENLRSMAEGCRFYAMGPESCSEEELSRAIEVAKSKEDIEPD